MRRLIESVNLNCPLWLTLVVRLILFSPCPISPLGESFDLTGDFPRRQIWQEEEPPGAELRLRIPATPASFEVPSVLAPLLPPPPHTHTPPFSGRLGLPQPWTGKGGRRGISRPRLRRPTSTRRQGEVGRLKLRSAAVFPILASSTFLVPFWFSLLHSTTTLPLPYLLGSQLYFSQERTLAVSA